MPTKKEIFRQIMLPAYFCAFLAPVFHGIGENLSVLSPKRVRPKPSHGRVFGVKGTFDHPQSDQGAQGFGHDQAEVPHPRRMAQKMVGQAHELTNQVDQAPEYGQRKSPWKPRA
ncbi:MAG TPA: hypothetical protein VME63_18305 [Dyella sp.]|nr:hypothetical protein [Dyella sp.]HTV87353.1 hypothetical protein [Dyella sp.]